MSWDRPLGYVVIEYNQASHWPSVWSGDTLYDSADEAREYARDAEKDARGRGRMERYTVAQVIEIEDDE